MNIYRKLLFVVLLLVGTIFSSAFAQQNDALLQILQQEMRKNFSQLDHDQSGVYLLSYRVEEQTSHMVKTSMGSLLQANNETKPTTKQSVS